MIMEYHWFLELFLLLIGTVLLKVQAQVSITARQPNAKVKEGSNYTLTWDFNLQSGESLREIVFGLWEKGYTSSYFITVTQSRGAVQNPEMNNKHPSYVGRVQWVGDISKSYAAFRLSNIKLSDNKTYGCQLGIGSFGQTKDSKMTLTVEKSSLALKKSTIVSVPSARIGIVGQAIEFKWVYRYHISDADFKAVQLSQRTNPQTKSRLLWKVQNNINTTIPEYANRLLVSVDIKNEQNHQTKSYTFKLVNLSRDDEGDYEFKIEFTKKQQDLESRVFLDVLARPRLIIGFQQVKGIYKEGQTLLLACKSEETSTPKVRWIKNGRQMPHHTDSFYSVNKLSISDAGVYSCCVYYALGNISSLGVRVRVQYAPKIISPSETRTVLSWKGNPTKFECSAVGDPVAKFLWTRADKRLLDGEFETSGNTSVLTIIPLADSDFSNYTCTSRNVIGEDSKSFILKPIRPPSPPTITNIVVNYNAIKVLWETPSTKQDTPITGHVLRIKKKGGFNRRLEVTFKAKSNYYILGNLTKGTNYIVWLYATNVAGRSNASEEKQVKTPLNGRPSLPSLHFTDVKINHTNFLVTWDFPADDGGAEVNCFTVWYRAVGINSTQDKWLTVNTTKNSYYLKLNCCITYEIMVTAWNENGPSIADPDNAARITVLRDLPDNRTLSTNDPQEIGSSYQEDTEKKVVLSYLSIVAVLIIPVLVCCLVKSRICKESPLNVKINDGEEREDEMEVLVSSAPVPHVPLWEFPRNNLAIERVIGNGAFGVVSKAYARNLPGKPEWTIVAVKSVQDGATESERRDLFSELNLLKKLKPHPHIIRLLGCITTEPDGPFVIIEYVPYGDLLGYLRRSRGVADCYYDDPDNKPSTNLTSDQMLKFAWQISDGMRYIASKKILHRDLAARNVLVGENHRCKITDFGMARDVNLEEIYVPRTEGRIPVKWTAIEAMTGAMKYSTQSDVWSFGVVLFEICTIGAEPYPGISPFKLPNVLLKGYRLPKPEYVKEELYAIMMECWETEPENRPSFNSLCTKIKSLEVQTNQNYVNITDCLQAYENVPTETSCLST